MNQSILFPDIQQWDKNQQLMTFPAQYGGALIGCYITKTHLERVSGMSIQSSEQALTVFRICRFDLEELAEALIEDECYDAEGKIEVVG